VPEGNPIVGNLNLLDPKDRGLIRRSATDALNRRKRWDISDAFKAELVQGLRAALNAAAIDGDYKTVNDCVRTAAVLEKMNQDDEHLAEKNARLDDGKPTDGAKLEVVYVNRLPPVAD